MTTSFNIENIPSKKEKIKLLDTIKKLIPEPIPWKAPTQEELLALIRPLIPDAPKTASRAELKKMIGDYIEKHKWTAPTLEFEVKETDQGTEIYINWKKHIIPKAVYAPKLRNLQQMGDVSVVNPDSGQGLIFRDGYWVNEDITTWVPTLQQVTDEGNTTTNDIEANSFIKTGGTSSEFLKADGSLNAVNGGWGGGYNNFTLDANGIANVSLTGISKFWTRLNWDTDNSFGGTWSSNKSSYYNSYLADQTGTSNDPKLTITYTLPIANNNFLLMF